MSDDKLYDDVRRAQAAKALLGNELLKDTFEYLEHSYTEAWRACKDQYMREVNWYSINALERVKDHLQTAINDGRLAQAQIEELVRMQKQNRRAA